MQSFDTSQIDNRIKEIETQLNFIEKVGILQTDIERFAPEINFRIERIIHEINFKSLLSELELCYLTKHIILSKSEMENQYFVKMAYLNIHEFSVAYNKQVKSIKEISPSSDYLNAFKKINAYLEKVKTKHLYSETTLLIRNKMAAHYELSMFDYFRHRKLLNEHDCLSIISDFRNFHHKLFMFIALLFECHSSGKTEKIDVESIFETLTK